MSDAAQKISAALARIRELDQTDDSGVDYDGWGNATLRHMSSYHTASHIAYVLNAELGREAITVTPRTKEVGFTIYHTVGIDGHMYPAGESQSTGEVVCGFDVFTNDAERREEKTDTAGRIHYFWKQVRRDNHLLDCELMIIVAAVITKLIAAKEGSGVMTATKNLSF